MGQSHIVYERQPTDQYRECMYLYIYFVWQLASYTKSATWISNSKKKNTIRQMDIFLLFKNNWIHNVSLSMFKGILKRQFLQLHGKQIFFTLISITYFETFSPARVHWYGTYICKFVNMVNKKSFHLSFFTTWCLRI